MIKECTYCNFLNNHVLSFQLKAIMNTLLKPLKVRETLLDKKAYTFTQLDFENIFQVTPTRAKYFLESQTDEGLLTRLKRGIYALKTDLPSAEEIANALYKPSYISFDYALALYKILPEMPYAITSATTKPTRDLVSDGRAYSYFTIKTEAYTGYKLVSVDNPNPLKDDLVHFAEMNSGRAYLIAEPEKALVDYLYFVSIGKRILNDRLFIKPGTLNKRKVIKYANLYHRKRLLDPVKEVYDNQ